MIRTARDLAKEVTVTEIEKAARAQKLSLQLFWLSLLVIGIYVTVDQLTDISKKLNRREKITTVQVIYCCI